MKLKLAILAFAACLLTACDYCPQPGVLEFTNQYYTPRTPKYPIPTVTACEVQPGQGAIGRPVYVGNDLQ